MSMQPPYDSPTRDVQDALDVLTRTGSELPAVEAAVILGSGLGAGASGIDVSARVAYGELPGLGECTVPGHTGELIFGVSGGKRLAIFSGRRHFYETGSMAGAAFPVRLAAAMGAKFLVQFSAVGAVDPALTVGDWLFVDDHLNLMGKNPLSELSAQAGVPAFVDLSRVYRTELYEPLAHRLAQRTPPVTLKRGVLAAFAGPTYETPAEIRMVKTLGASAVGMSVVPEAVWAACLALKTVAIGLVVNPAAVVAQTPLDHSDVLDAAGQHGPRAAQILETIVDLI